MLEDMAIVQMIAPCRPQYRPKVSVWHRVLDDLSWLCDNLPAGRSVSSIAAQKEQCLVLYIASGDANDDGVCQNLRSIVGCLSYASSTGEIRTMEDILQLCLERSKPKITEYVHRFRRELRRAYVDVSVTQTDLFVAEHTCIVQLDANCVADCDLYMNLTPSTTLRKGPFLKSVADHMT